MRNPNGFGCVYKASGNRRKPYIARITVGWDENTGRQIFKNLGSYATSPEAYIALSEYNSDPYDIDAAKITFRELFEKWRDQKYNRICRSMQLSYNNAFRASEPLHELPFVSIKTHQIQMTINNADRTYSGKERMKMLISQMYDLAMKNDIVKKNNCKFVDLGEKPPKQLNRIPFTESEIEILYKCVHVYRYIDTILMMIFSGIRPGELITIETQNVFLDENYFICGIKTENGKNRKIPISPLVKPFFIKYYNDATASGSKWLIQNTEGHQMKYANYNGDKFVRIMEQLEMKHMPHDCRHTFATLMQKVGSDKLCLQNIMGHSPTVLVDKVYTHKDVSELFNEVKKLETIFNPEKYVSMISPKYYENQYLFVVFESENNFLKMKANCV